MKDHRFLRVGANVQQGGGSVKWGRVYEASGGAVRF